MTDTDLEDPWAETTIDGARLLDDVEQFLARFVAYPGEHERVAHVLWIAHTWFMDAWESTPRIAFLSPEPGSGKSRALEVTEPLVPRPVHAVNATPAYLFRKVSDEEGPPTLLYDEIDTVFGPKAKDNEDIRGMLNAGHRRGAMAGRCVIRGKSVEIEELPSYCAVALAGLDDLPDTIMTRSVIVRMRRRAPNERVEPWRMRVNGPQAAPLGDRLADWSSDHRREMVNAWPEFPPGVEDRDADVWEALLAVADLAGGTWPTRAREAAVALTKAKSQRPPSIGVLLLRDLRTVFTEAEADKLRTEEILDRLHMIDESPWADLRGKALDARGLSYRLGKYAIKPRTLRDGSAVFKGYSVEDLRDAWERYVPAEPSVTTAPIGYSEPPPPPSRDSSVTSVTAVTPQVSASNPVTDPAPVTDEPPARNRVTDVTAESRRGREKCSECAEPLDQPGFTSRCRPNHQPEIRRTA